MPVPGQTYQQRLIIDAINKAFQHLCDANRILSQIDVAYYLEADSASIKKNFTNLLSQFLAYFMQREAQAYDLLMYPRSGELENAKYHVERALTSMTDVFKFGRDLDMPKLFLEEAARLFSDLEELKSEIEELILHPVARLKGIAFQLKAISDKTRFFDMYATFVMKDKIPEAQAIFNVEVDYLKNLFLKIMMRIFSGQINALYEVFFYVFLDELKSIGDYLKDSDIRARLKNLPLPDIEKLYYDEFEKRVTQLEEFEQSKLEEVANDVWYDVKFTIIKTLKDYLSKHMEGPSSGWRKNVPIGTVVSIFETLDFEPKPWVEIASVVQQLENASGDFVFLLLDRLFDMSHHRGDLAEYIGKLLPWFSTQLLDIKSNANSLNDLAPYCSGEVKNLIREYEALY